MEFPRLEGKPTLQAVGGSLDRIQLRLRLHNLNTNPSLALQALIDAAEEKQPLEFIFGDIYEGNYVIDSIDEEILKSSTVEGENTIFEWIDVRLSLLEWVGEIVEEGIELIFSGFPYSDPFA